MDIDNSELKKQNERKFMSISNNYDDVMKELMEQRIELTKLDATLSRIELSLARLALIIDQMKHDSNKMSDHVDFVNGVYDQVKRPFHMAMNAVSSLHSISAIEDKTNNA